MGPEKLDNAVYLIRGLYDLADLAQSRHDGATQAWASQLARRLQRHFDGTWWDAAAQQYADSLTASNQQSFQKHWIGQTPMEAELHVSGQTVAGLAPLAHGTTALAGRENDCFSGTHPLSPGLFHTACGGGPDGKGERVVYGLTTSIQSVGEGNYGRLGPGEQHQWLGVQPDLGRGAVAFVPQVPPGQPSVAGRDIRLGGGSADVAASYYGSEYRTEIDVTPGTGAQTVIIGGTLPGGTRPTAVELDGQPVTHFGIRWTNRGTEVTVPTTAGQHTLVITG